MIKKSIVVLAVIISTAACARVRVEAPKDPIKVDISMRLDIYQHVQKDIDAIEDMVSGASAGGTQRGEQSSLKLGVRSAFAAEGDLSKEVEDAALRRKTRRPSLQPWLESGAAGENRSGLLEKMRPQDAGSPLTELIRQENYDRMVIYESVARKNGTTVEEVQKLYAKRLQSDAPAGTRIEVFNEAKNVFSWEIKR
jgi:uncharacterized protein YdbL (DUF1318 family)